MKVEQDFEIASNEYEHWNTLVKQELPHFFQLSTSFIEPIFHSFYYMQYVPFPVPLTHRHLADPLSTFARLNCFYLMQEKLQSFADGKYDLSRTDVENVYFEQRGDAAEHLEELTITKRMVSTGRFMLQRDSVWTWTEHPFVSQPNSWQTVESPLVAAMEANLESDEPLRSRLPSSLPASLDSLQQANTVCHPPSRRQWSQRLLLTPRERRAVPGLPRPARSRRHLLHLRR